MKGLRVGWDFPVRRYQVFLSPFPTLMVNLQTRYYSLRALKKDCFGNEECTNESVSPFKITFVGAGRVGIASAFICLLQGITNEICFIDTNENKLKGEIKDLLDGSRFLNGAKIYGSSDYKDSTQSALCIISAGETVNLTQTRMDILNENAEHFKKIIPNLIKYSPNTILIVVSNPVDPLSYIAWKLSGLPQNKVFGTGTILDSARFRYFLSKKINVSVQSVYGIVIGEHGETSVPIWSSVNVAGVPFKNVYKSFGSPEDPEKWFDIYSKVLQSAYEVKSLKGNTTWAVSVCCAQLAEAVLRNQNTVHPVSTLVQGVNGVKEEVYNSLPCVIGSCGVKSIVQQSLTQEEVNNFQLSCKYIHEALNKVSLN